MEFVLIGSIVIVGYVVYRFLTKPVDLSIGPRVLEEFTTSVVGETPPPAPRPMKDITPRQAPPDLDEARRDELAHQNPDLYAELRESEIRLQLERRRLANLRAERQRMHGA